MIRRALLALGVTFAFVVVPAAPAWAHTGKTVKATNDKPELLGLKPEIKGLTVRLIDSGTRIELDAGDHVVYVFGYEGEDYLRIDDRGVYENSRSSAVYLNRAINAAAPPGYVDPTAPASWRKVSDGRVARWHDHSLHVPPGMKLRGPIVSRWDRELLVDDQPVKIEGRVVRSPSRSRLPWLLAASGLALMALVVARRAWAKVVVVGLGLLVVADATRLVGLVAHTPTWFAPRYRVIVDASTLSIVGWGMAVSAIVLVAKRRRLEAATAATLAGAVLALTGGVLEARDLSAAFLGTSLPDTLARVVVAVELGVGAGLAVASVLQIRRLLSTPTSRGLRSGSGLSPGGGTRRGSPSASSSA